jgi:predicted dinucleotide-binding enzyme
MSYAIIGFGKIGQALAKAFARQGIEVSVATTRDPESFAADAAAIGPTVVAETLADAVKADMIFLAVRYESHPDVAKVLPSWEGKTIIDAMNLFPAPEEVDALPSSAVVAKAFAGAKLVKGFNHLGATTLAADPVVEGGHRSLPWRPWPNNSDSNRSIWESSTKVARLCKPVAVLGAR